MTHVSTSTSEGDLVYRDASEGRCGALAVDCEDAAVESLGAGTDDSHAGGEPTIDRQATDLVSKAAMEDAAAEANCDQTPPEHAASAHAPRSPGGPPQDPPCGQMDDGDDRDDRDDLLDQLLDEAYALQGKAYKPIKRLLKRAVDGNLDPGEISHLKDAISSSTKMNIAVLHQVHLDVRNTLAKGNVAHSAALVAADFRERLAEHYPEVVWSEGLFWTYVPIGNSEPTPDAGFFGHSTLSEVDDEILRAYGKLPSVDSKGKRDEVLIRLRAATAQDDYFSDAAAGANFDNGFLRYDAGTTAVQLEPHSPRHKARYRLEFDYDEAAKAPNFLASLAITLPDQSSRDAVREFIGCALLRVSPSRDDAMHTLFCKGINRSGKSALLEIIGMLFHESAIANVAPNLWRDEKYRIGLAGKAINIVTELGREVLPTAMLKTIISHEPVAGRKMRKDPVYFRPYAWHCWASNTVLRIDEDDKAIERRILCVPFNRRLEDHEVDPNFLQKVAKELPGIATWAIEGAVEAMRRGSFTRPVGHEDILFDMRHGDNPAAWFVRDCIEPAPRGTRPLSTKDIHTAFLAWGIEKGMDTSAWHRTSHARRIKDELTDQFGSEQSKTAGIPHYSGIRLKGAL